MKILITGAGGQMGTLLQQVASSSVRLAALTSRQMDITSMAQVQAAIAGFEPDVVINAGAYTQVDKAESEQEQAFLVNQQGVENLILATRSQTRLIHISTDFVFDGNKRTPYTPDDHTNPLSVYGKSKLAGETALLEHAASRSTIIRTAWLYSPGGKNFVNTMLSLMQSRESLRVVNDQHGTPTSAAGLAEAIWRVVQRPSATGILHWTDTGDTTWYGFAQEIQRLGVQYGLLPRVIPITPIGTHDYPTPATRPQYSVLDKTDTYAKLGKTALSWQQALEQVMGKKIAAFREQREHREYREMNKLLVTGGAGFIGSNFVHYWLTQHPQDTIVVLDALTYAGNKHNLKACHANSLFRFVQGSINDQTLVEKLLEENDVDTLVHFAAESHVDRSITGPDAFIDTNINGTHSLLKACRKIWSARGGFAGKRFHHVSTDEVYGTLKADDPAFTETTPYAPNSPYAASKASSDHLVRAYHHTYGLPVTTSNCSNNYGPYQFPEKLLPLCLLNILQGKPLPIYGDGMQVRDWLHVDDHNRGIELILQQGTVGDTWNIGGNNEWANLDTVKLLCSIVDDAFQTDPALKQRFPGSPCSSASRAESLISFVADRPGHDTRYAINAAKITAELGYRPHMSFVEGLTQTVQWYLRNEPWWRAIQDKSYLT